MSTDQTEDTGFKLGFERAKYGVSHQDLEAKGERLVRDELNSGKYGHAGLAPFEFVSAWLADAEFSRLEAREEESLSIARKALRSSHWANAIAITAAIIAISAVIMEASK